MRYLLCLFIVSCFAACKARVRDEDYFPMQMGDKHTYEITRQKPAEQFRRGIILRVEVIEEVKRTGKDYWRIRSDFTGEGHSVLTTLYRKDQGGVFGIVEQNPDGRELQIIKFPLKAGASWEVLMGKQNNRFSVIGFEDVTVGGVTYRRCVHLHSESNDGSILDNWKAPGIGDIKSVQSNSAGMNETSVLQEFKPGK
jgi:hypothetical protein